MSPAEKQPLSFLHYLDEIAHANLPALLDSPTPGVPIQHHRLGRVGDGVCLVSADILRFETNEQ